MLWRRKLTKIWFRLFPRRARKSSVARAKTLSDLDDDGVIDQEIGPDVRPDFSHITDPQPVTLSARLSDDGPFIPDGLVWRVFDTEVDETGELALVAKSEESTATLSLPPGEYVMHVAYGRAQVSDTLFVEPGPNTHTIVFEVGGLNLNAMVSGDVPIPPDLVRFDVYSQGPDGRVTVAENLVAGELIHLNAGIYSIVSRFGPINAVVRSELRVEPGQVTEATLFHRAAQVALRLVSEEGGEAIADVEWTIQTPQGETIFSDIGAFPALCSPKATIWLWQSSATMSTTGNSKSPRALPVRWKS